MSNMIKMFVRPKIQTEEFFEKKAIASRKNTLFVIKFGDIVKPVFKFESCRIKYPLGRFEKIVFKHNEEEFITNLNLKIKEALGEEASRFVEIREDELGVKIQEVLKTDAESFNPGEYYDFLIEFNNCWVMANKIYPSFVLKDYHEIVKPEVKKEEFGEW